LPQQTSSWSAGRQRALGLVSLESEERRVTRPQHEGEELWSMRIGLVFPTNDDFIVSRKFTSYPPLGLAILAGVTPSQHEVTIIDERIQSVELDNQFDVVGMTVMTPFANRAYEIADELRSSGVKVVLGGMHASAVPEEAIAHADAVVIGEAERVWPKVLDDSAQGEMQPFYRSASLVDMDRVPFARRELFRERAYLAGNTIQVSRGCPLRCSFCAVSSFFGGTYRFRRTEDVISELEPWSDHTCHFIDDNIIGSLSWAKELFRAMIPLGLRWGGMASMNIIADTELLELAAESGCKCLLIGFESIREENLRSIGKSVNRLDNYAEVVDRLHDYGISVEAAFMFGFDHDEESVFEETVRFAEEARVDYAHFSVLTPFPGTALHRELSEANRIVDTDWSRYTWQNAVFEPRLISRDALEKGVEWAQREFYSYSSIWRRVGIGGTNPALMWAVNLHQRDRLLGLPRRKLYDIAGPMVTRVWSAVS
jgi:radical SAM superfamily enzyme YgiQ (UPF0313 family)